MNLKAIKSSYGDFGRVARGAILRDVAKDLADKLIKSGAYAVAAPEDLKSADEKAASPSTAAKTGTRSRKSKERDDGPTIGEYVAAGYLASTYPPRGFSSRSSVEEIASAVEAEAVKADLAKMSRDQLIGIAEAENVEVGDVDNAALVEKITAARAAKT